MVSLINRSGNNVSLIFGGGRGREEAPSNMKLCDRKLECEKDPKAYQRCLIFALMNVSAITSACPLVVGGSNINVCDRLWLCRAKRG